MKCIILAAGYATRMYPLTENFPKPLLPVKGKKIIDWLIDDLDMISKGISIGCHRQFFVMALQKHKGLYNGNAG